MKPIRFKLCPVAREGRIADNLRWPTPSLLIDVDIRCIKEHFKTRPSYEQGGWGVENYDKYLRSLAVIENDDFVEAPALYLNGTQTGLKISDGRHRLQALADLDYMNIQIAVPEIQASRITEILKEHHGGRSM